MTKPLPTVQRWSPLAQKYGSRFGVPANVLLGLIQVETGGRTGLTSPAGARGLTQFEPGTARQYKVNVDKPASAIRGAAQYLRDLGFAKNPLLALAKYNAGPGNPRAGIGYAHDVLGASKLYHGGSYTPQAAPAGVSGSPVPLPTPQVNALTQALRPMRAVTPPAAPSFTAKVTQPSGYQAPPSVTPNPGPDLRSQLQAMLQADAPPPYQPGSAAPPSVPLGVSPSGKIGKVFVTAGANRAGVGLQKPILHFTHEVAGLLNSPITITTGTNHNQYVVGTTRQSDHWTGNAADIAVPDSSKRGDHIAASALQALGIPWKKALAMATKGGVFTITRGGIRYQILWKTNVGGNHFNHVHLGAMPLR